MTDPAKVFLIILLAPAVLLGSDRIDSQTAQTKERGRQTTAASPGDDKTAAQAEPVQEDDDQSLAKIEEFEVRLGAMGTEFQLAASQSLSEIVNPFTVRKRGRMYGSLYEYHRNDNFDARNFFDPVGEKLPEFKRNQFGGSFGFSLTNNLNLFGTYDGLRINRGSTMLSHIPTAEMKGGDFSSLDFQLIDPFTGEPFPDNRIPASRFNPVAVKMLETIPATNRSDPDRNYVNNQPSVRDSNTVTGRVDYELSKDSKIFGNYSWNDYSEVRVSNLPQFGSTQTRKHHNASFNYTRTINPNLVSSLGLGFDRNVEQELSADAGNTGLLHSLGIEGLKILDDWDEGYPQFDISGYATLGLGHRSQSPRTSFQNNFDLNGSLIYVRNSHKLSFGGEIGLRQINNDRTGGKRRGEFEFSGAYTGDAFADFLLGIPNYAERGMGSDRKDLRQRRWKAFIRDDWRINSKFSLSLSLTYNYNPFFNSVHDNISLFWPLVFEPPVGGAIVTTGSAQAREMGLTGLRSGQAVYPDRNDWEPKVGLAFSPLGNNRLVIRSSYQISYNPLDARRTGFLGQNWPFYYVDRAESSEDSPDLNLSHPFSSPTPTEMTVRAIDPHTRNAYVQEWQLSVQNEFRRNWNFEIGYEGRRAVRNDMVLPSNIPLPGPGLIQERRPNPNFGRFDIVTDGASSIGHTMRTELRKRFASYFSLQSEFQWNRTFSNEFGGDPSNPRNLKAERALGGYMPLLRFNVNYIVDLPFGRGRAFPLDWTGKLRWLLEGWRVSGITNIQGGRPFNPRLSGDPNNDGVRGDRPDRIGSGLVSPGERSVDRWFAIEDFVEPAEFAFGNSGRNILMTPGEHKWDISLIKKTKTSEDGNELEFRVQLFNAFNQTNFERPDTTFGSSSFGMIFGARESREIEIALKYSF